MSVQLSGEENYSFKETKSNFHTARETNNDYYKSDVSECSESESEEEEEALNEDLDAIANNKNDEIAKLFQLTVRMLSLIHI